MVKLDIEKALVDGFRIIKDRPVVMLPVVISHIILTILGYYAKFIMTFAGNEFMINGNEDPELVLREILNVLPLLISLAIISGLLKLFFDGLAIRMIYDAAFDKISFESVGFVIRKYPTLLLVSIVMAIIVLPAFILIIPGIYLSVRLGYVMEAVLIDNDGVVASLKKSWRVVRGNWWRTFALGLIIVVFMVIAYLTLGTILAVGMFTGLEDGTLGKVGDIIGIIVNGFMGTWFAAAFVMAYLQLTGRQKTPEDDVLDQMPEMQ